MNRGLKAGVFEMGDPTLSQIPHFPNFFISRLCFAMCELIVDELRCLIFPSLAMLLGSMSM